MGTGAAVVVRDLRKRYGPVAAVDGLSFEVREGEVFGLIGPNGAGKTTTVECLIGLREPDGGAIEIAGVDARTRAREVRRRIGAALQTTALQDQITPREAVELFGALYGVRPDTSALLDRFGLAEAADRAFQTLSGGQRQRLALALAFLHDPVVIVLDEPTAGLDPQSRRDLRARMAGLRREGRTLLLTTHDIDEAEALCDRIAIIDRGRLVASGTPADLIARSSAVPAVVVRTSPALAAGWLDGVEAIDGVVYDAHAARFRASPGALDRALAGLVARAAACAAEIVELHLRKATLEDVLMELTDRAAAPDA